MSITNHLTGPIAAALALGALAVAVPADAADQHSSPWYAGKSTIQDTPRSAEEANPVPKAPTWPTHPQALTTRVTGPTAPTWPTDPQALTARTTPAPAAHDGPSWTAAILVGGLLTLAAAALGAVAGRATARPRRAGA
jgi:hypothetical protein